MKNTGKKQRRLVLEQLENRVLFDAVPAVAVDAPTEAFIDEAIEIKVAFDNAAPEGSNETGHAPFIEFALEPGLQLIGNTVEYEGESLPVTLVGTFDTLRRLVDGESNVIDHPITGEPLTIPLIEFNSTLYLVELPFGSFAPDQPTAELTISAQFNSSQAIVPGFDQDVYARGGFRLGNTPDHDPLTDPPLVQSFVKNTIEPTIFNLQKEANAPEEETVSGVNYLQSWTLTVDIADGRTVDNLVLQDLLPPELTYQGILSVSGNALGTYSINQEPGLGGPSSPALLEISFGSVTGTAQSNDLVVTYQGYLGQNDANGNPVLNPTTGDDIHLTSTASIQGEYDHDANSFTAARFLEDTATATLDGRSLSIQESLSSLNSVAGDSIEHTLNFQISDYFEFDDIVITYTLSDGQQFDGFFGAKFFIEEQGVFQGSGAPSPQSWSPDHYSISLPSPETGEILIEFRVSDMLESLNLIGVDGTLTGDLFADGTQNGATQGTITFRTFIEQDFSTLFPSGDSSIDLGDYLTNNVVIDGQIPSSLSREQDVSQSTITIGDLSIVRSIYAINGNTASLPAYIQIGDEITYRITVDLSSADMENFKIIDYLPFAVFDATTLTTFVNTEDLTPPPVGSFWFHLNHNFPQSADLNPTTNTADPSMTTPAGVPVLLVDPTSNSLTWDFGNIDHPFNATSANPTIDLLFTVEVVNTPLTEDFLLAAQSQVSYQNTALESFSSTSTQQMQLVAPDLQITKGIVSTDKDGATFTPEPSSPTFFTDPGLEGLAFFSPITGPELDSIPINSDLSGVDAGDLVKFAIVIQNTGDAETFDLLIRDQLPEGLTLSTSATGLNLQIRRGDNPATPIAFTDADGNAFASSIDQFDAFFGQGAFATNPGIRISDIDSDANAVEDQGRLAAGMDLSGNDVTDGSDILIITYDLIVTSSVAASAASTASAQITSFASQEGGTNIAKPSLVDAATVTIQDINLSNDFVSTGIVSINNNNNEAVIGETVTYRLTIDVPEGQTPFFNVIDTFGPDLTDFNLLSISFNNFDSATFTVNTTDNGDGSVTFSVNSLNNFDNDSDIEQIIIEYEVKAANVLENQKGTLLSNSAVASYGYTMVFTDPAVASDGFVEEPRVFFNQDFLPNSTVDAGDTVNYFIDFVVNQFGFNSSVSAFDVQLEDILPQNLDNITIVAVNDTSNQLSVGSFQIVGNTLSLIDPNGFDMIPTTDVFLHIRGTVSNTVLPNESIDNYSSISWSSLDGNPSIERDGSDGVGSVLNDYFVEETTSITVRNITLNQFIASTSESSTGANTLGQQEVAVGEVVRYRIQAEIPEGTIPNFMFQELLANGLQFLDDGTASLAIVGDNASNFSSSRFSTSTPGLFVSDATPLSSIIPTVGLDSITPDGISDSLTSHSDLYSSGTDVYFKLGDFANLENDFDSEYLILEFNAVVVNEIGNQAGTTLQNSANALYNNDNNGDGDLTDPGDVVIFTTSAITNANTVQVVEPILNVDHVTTSTPPVNGYQAGDLVSYRATISHDVASTSGAFDVLISDLLDSGSGKLTIDSVLLNLSGGAVVDLGAGGFNNTTTGFNGIFDIPQGGIVEILYTVELESSIEPNEVFSNNLTTTWTSHNGNFSNERNGSDGLLNDGSLNDYQLTDTEIITAGLTFNSTITTLNGNEFTLGDIIQYEIQIEVTKGTTSSIGAVDFIQQGLIFVQGSFTVEADGMTTDFIDEASNVTYNFSGTNASISIGDVVNPSDDQDNIITIRFDVLVFNSGTFDDGELFRNRVWAFMTDGNGGGKSSIISVDSFLVEPFLDINVVASDDTPHLGDIITYTTTLTHSATSGTTAYDLNLTDLLAPHLTLLGPVVIDPSSTGYSGFTDSSAGTIDVQFDELTFAPGSQIIFTYQVQVTSDPLQFGTDHTTTTNLDWSTQPGVDPNERTGSGIAQNDLNAAISEQITIVGPDLAVSHNDGIQNRSPGDTYSYSIQVTNQNTGTSLNGVSLSETATNVLVQDILPYGVTPTGNFNLAPSSVILLPNGQYEVTWIIPSLAVNATENLTVEVQVDNPFPTANSFPVGLSENELFNQVTVTAMHDPDGNGTLDPLAEPNLLNNSSTDTDQNDAAPQIILSQSDELTNVQPGDIFSYTLRLENSGNQNAIVNVTDFFPNHILNELDPGAIPLLDGIAGVYNSMGAGSGNAQIQWTGVSLEAGEVITVTFDVSVRDPQLSAGNQLTNRVEVTEVETGTSVSLDTNTLIAIPDLIATISDGLDSILPGKIAHYQIQIANLGNQQATGIVVTNQLPSESIFIQADQGGSYLSASREVIWNFADLDGGNSEIITLNVTVLIPEAIKAKTLISRVSIFDDGLNGIEASFLNNTQSDSTRVTSNSFLNVGEVNIFQRFYETQEEEEFSYLSTLLNPYPNAILSLAPIYSGHAKPGTTLVITIHDASGAIIGTQSVIADSGGNWLATLPNTVIKDRPHVVSVEQTLPNYSLDDQGPNSRTYFSSAINNEHFFVENQTIEAVFSERASKTVEEEHQASSNPIITWADEDDEF